jgi:hypothetical protein
MPAAFLGEELGVPHDSLRPPRRNFVHEVAAAHLQPVIDEELELVRPTDGQMPLDDDPVKTGQNPGDEAGKLDDERADYLHGIRFLNDCLVTIILESRMPVFILLGRWAKPALRSWSHQSPAVV